MALEGARALADEAGAAFDRAWAPRRSPHIAGARRLRSAIAAAKVATTRASLDVASRIFEVTGARATTAKRGLDRFWRNVRTHTLHDPVDYKLRELGHWALSDACPRLPSIHRAHHAWTASKTPSPPSRGGGMAVVVDDADRENEGDLIMAAEKATPAAIAFIVRHTSGVVCAALTGARLRSLQLPLMVADNAESQGTAFTITVDDRPAPAPGSRPPIARRRWWRSPTRASRRTTSPGLVTCFRCAARPGGVLERRGHTEAAVDLARAAGLSPAASCARSSTRTAAWRACRRYATFAARHHLPLVASPTWSRIAGAPNRWSRASPKRGSHAAWPVHGARLPRSRRARACRAGHGRGAGHVGRAGARPLRVPHGRHLRLAPLRLRRPARRRARTCRGRGARRRRLPARARRTRRRPHPQAARLSASGPGARHGRGQPGSRAARSTRAATMSARRS